jgi:hypothetical protein
MTQAGPAMATIGAVAAALVDAERRLPDGRTLTEFAPDAKQLAAFQQWVRVFCTRWSRVADKCGVQGTMTVLALSGPDRLTASAAKQCFRTGLAGLRARDCGQPPVPRRVLPPAYLGLVIGPPRVADSAFPDSR